MKITIRKEHLAAAIKDMKTGQAWTQHCVVAQAVKQVIPDFSFCGVSSVVTKSGPDYQTTAAVRKIIRAFDRQDYDKVKELLPLTFDALTRA